MLTRARDRSDTVGIGPAPAIDLEPLLGGWVNYNTRSTGIIRLEMSDRGGAPTVRVFGAGLSAPIDWGEVACAMFANGVDRHEAVGFTASYELGFAHVLLAGYLNKRLLVVDAYSIFTDGSGRANYFQRDHFYLP